MFCIACSQQTALSACLSPHQRAFPDDDQNNGTAAAAAAEEAATGSTTSTKPTPTATEAVAAKGEGDGEGVGGPEVVEIMSSGGGDQEEEDGGDEVSYSDHYLCLLRDSCSTYKHAIRKISSNMIVRPNDTFQ